MANRKRTFKIALTCAAAAGLIVLVVVFLQLRSQQGGSVPIPMPAAKALMTLAKVHQTATKDGKVQWELDADSAQLEASGGRMILTAPKVKFHMEDGTLVHLTAEQGILHTNNNDMKVTGRVHLHNDQYTLTTEILVYLHDQRLLKADAPVRIESSTASLRANRMTYDLTQNRAHFEGQVEGDLHERPAI